MDCMKSYHLLMGGQSVRKDITGDGRVYKKPMLDRERNESEPVLGVELDNPEKSRNIL